MTRNLFLLLLVTFSSQLAFSQKVTVDSLCWIDHAKLKWNDFKGMPDTLSMTYMGTKGTAATRTNVQARGYVESGLPNFKISNYFIRSQSWTTDTTKANDIRHEQLHFDISELHARKMRNGICELRSKKINDINIYTDFIKKTLDELHNLNHKYDIETGHGVIDFRQEEWSVKIKKELDLLKKYATRPS